MSARVWSGGSSSSNSYEKLGWVTEATNSFKGIRSMCLILIWVESYANLYPHLSS